MKLNTLLKNLPQALSGVKLGGKRDAKLGALDRGILEVALLIAALDGEILPAEYETFVTLAKQSRGYTEKNLKELVDRALHGAGYLMAAAQVGVVAPSARIARFVTLASAALPSGFAYGSYVDLRRGFALWVAMAASDGEISAIEREAIEQLRRIFTEKRIQDAVEFEAYQRMCSPAYRMAYLDSPKKLTQSKKLKVQLIEADFIDKAAAVLKKLAAGQKLAADALVKFVMEG